MSNVLRDTTIADLDPATLALMHGSSYRGNGAQQLRALADHYAEALRRTLDV